MTRIWQGFELDKLGGFPLTQERLAHMQTAYGGISEAIVGICGHTAILAGVEEDIATDTLSDGWVIINGELLPFVGGQKIYSDMAGNLEATIVVRETRTNLLFKDGVNKPVQYTRYACSGLYAPPAAVTLYSYLNNHRKGISNLPNATTNDPTVSNANILATSQAVNEVYRKIGADIDKADRFVTSGRVLLDSNERHLVITHNVSNLDFTKLFITFEVFHTGGMNSNSYSRPTSIDKSVYDVVNMVLSANGKELYVSIRYQPTQFTPDSDYYFTYKIEKID